MATAPLLLSASNIRFAYGDAPVLNDVSVSLCAGQVQVLLGPNGSGKSTLIRILLGQLIGEGSVAWDGRNLHSWRKRDLAKFIAYLPQTPTFQPGQNVLDVLRLGRAPYWGAFGVESARDAHVVDEISKLLELSDLLHRPMDQISGGQRQRVFIGRCLVQEPRALLLDEPSTFLDIRHHIELCSLLRRLAREHGLAVLMASHDLNLAATFADCMMILRDGKVAAAGRPAEVMQPELLQEIYGVPIGRVDTSDGRPIVYPVV